MVAVEAAPATIASASVPGCSTLPQLLTSDLPCLARTSSARDLSHLPPDIVSSHIREIVGERAYPLWPRQ